MLGRRLYPLGRVPRYTSKLLEHAGVCMYRRQLQQSEIGAEILRESSHLASQRAASSPAIKLFNNCATTESAPLQSTTIYKQQQQRTTCFTLRFSRRRSQSISTVCASSFAAEDPRIMAPTILHLRHEEKPLEHRSALTPTTAKALLDAGYTVNVEKSPARIFDDEEFTSVGCSLVPTGSWREAPADHIIVGLKELPEEECK